LYNKFVDFRWNDWNLAKCEKHGVAPADAQYVVERAKSPFPRRIDQGKLLVWGPGTSGQYLQVIYLLDPGGTSFIIHAMPLNDRQIGQLRRRQR